MMGANRTGAAVGSGSSRVPGRQDRQAVTMSGQAATSVRNMLWRVASEARRAGRRVLGPSLAAGMMVAAVPAPAANLASVRVDAGSDGGPVPLIQRVGTWPFTPAPPLYVQDQFFADFRAGTVEIDLGQEVFRPSSDRAEVMGRLALLDPFLKRLQARGMQVVIAFSKMPPFLSAGAGKAGVALAGDASTISDASPPRDYDAWGRLVGDVVTHIRDLGLHASYNIGWEPDTAIWQGTSAEFFKLYRTAALAVKRADPLAKVGGPAVSDFGPQWRDKPTDPPMIEAFLGYAGRTALPELGLARLPVDFVSYHLFGGSTATSYMTRTRRIRSLLMRNGYDVQTPVFIGEWSSGADPTDARREQPFMAAYVVASVDAMSRAKVGSAAYTGLTEQQVSDTTEFNGGLGLFTKSFIKRSSYRAFQMLDALGGTSLPVASDAGAVVALASRSPDKVVIVAANFLPIADTFRREFLDRLVDQDHTVSSLMAALKSADRIDGVLRGDIDAKSMAAAPLSADMTAAAGAIRVRAKGLAATADGSTTVKFTVANLGWLGAFDVATYRIDATHGNPLALKGEIDQRMAAVTATSAARIKRDYRAILGKNGVAPATIEDVAAFGAAGMQPSALAKLEVGRRLEVIKAIRILQAEQDSAVAAVADTFNKDPRLNLVAVDKRSVAATKQFEVSAPIDPQGVLMLVLTRK